MKNKLLLLVVSIVFTFCQTYAQGRPGETAINKDLKDAPSSSNSSTDKKTTQSNPKDNKNADKKVSSEPQKVVPHKTDKETGSAWKDAKDVTRACVAAGMGNAARNPLSYDDDKIATAEFVKGCVGGVVAATVYKATKGKESNCTLSESNTVKYSIKPNFDE